MTDIDLREPTTIDHLISPHAPLLRTALDAYWQDCHDGRNPAFGPCLLHGPAGLGKRLAARILAQELGLETLEILASTAWRSSEVGEFFFDAYSRGAAIIILCDAPMVPLVIQDRFYYAVKIGLLTVRHSAGHMETIRFDLRRCPILLCCTEPRMGERVLSQFRLRLGFGPYNKQQMDQIVRQRAGLMAWSLADEGVSQIVGASKGRPGLAVQVLRTSWMVCRAGGRSRISGDDVSQAVRLLEDQGSSRRSSKRSASR